MFLRHQGTRSGELVARARGVSFAYRAALPVLDGVDLDVRRGEIVALEGPNGSGKTTLARIAAGLLEPQAGTVELRGRAGYLSQDPGRYLVTETALDEVALAVNGDEQRARAALDRVRARLGGRPPSARPLERRARAARARRGRGRGAGPAHPRRADARRRPRAEGGARRLARGVRRVREGGPRRDPRPRAARRTAESNFVFQQHKPAARCAALPSRVAARAAPRGGARARRLGRARPRPRRASRRCWPRSPCSSQASRGSRAAPSPRAT